MVGVVVRALGNLEDHVYNLGGQKPSAMSSVMRSGKPEILFCLCSAEVWLAD
ncbi:hypothetical protein M758_3G011000 [Ceratodon purpureus]|nr:hypothetical protein M758_3G011000 [Ceratodon purpureus]